MQAGGMPNSRDAGQKCYRKGGMQERRRTGFYRAKVGASNDDREGVHLLLISFQLIQYNLLF